MKEIIEVLLDLKGLKVGGIKLSRGSFSAGCRSSYHTHHDTDELVYCLSGSGLMLVEGEPQELNKGGHAYIALDSAHLVSAATSGLEILAFHFYREKLK